ncbi:hypothetical protein EV356DRAFT_477162 [Viridothelium virens]|uniref:Uncharacterized protein n=1 Tax=Viridothelium virens TaxID=1048519 RepID=A0A6A6GS48_VIRVR|nr:hypothetical protein EV356DRAFT_477162 [Viridothelium virens]
MRRLQISTSAIGRRWENRDGGNGMDITLLRRPLQGPSQTGRGRADVQSSIVRK